MSTRLRMVLELDNSTFRGSDVRRFLQDTARAKKLPAKTFQDFGAIVRSLGEAYLTKKFSVYREPRKIKFGKSLYKQTVAMRGTARRVNRARAEVPWDIALPPEPERPTATSRVMQTFDQLIADRQVGARLRQEQRSQQAAAQTQPPDNRVPVDWNQFRLPVEQRMQAQWMNSNNVQVTAPAPEFRWVINANDIAPVWGDPEPNPMDEV